MSGAAGLGWPKGRGRRVCACAVAVWAGVLVGGALGVAPAVVAAVLLAGVGGLAGRLPVVLCVVCGMASGALGAARVSATLAADVPVGRVEVGGRVATEPYRGPFGTSFAIRPAWLVVAGEPVPWDGPRMTVDVEDPPDGLDVGAAVLVTGRATARPSATRAGPVAGSIDAAAVAVLGPAGDPILRAGSALRNRVTTAAAREKGAGSALLAGFLVGDTSRLTPADVDALRRSGLAHFVAVSGGNVALVLGAWWLVMAPLGVSARVRSVLGLGALGVFVAATRWEPSVLRAAAMAALVLGGRVAGVPVDPWVALGSAVSILLAVAPELAMSVGFQLSAFATAGLLLGAPVFGAKRPRLLWTALGATLSAQCAVLPLLLMRFGTVPLLAPAANLVAAPLVAAATSIGGIGTLSGVSSLTAAGAALAGVVLRLAHQAAGWPQLGPVAAVAVVTGAGAALRLPRARPLVAALAVVALGASLLPVAGVSVATATVLDVGQGDAILLQVPGGAVALVDGGRDPLVLASGLRRHGVDHIDLLVATHGDGDHVGGLVGIFDVVDVGALWLPREQVLDAVLDGIVAEAIARRIAVASPPPGTRVALGELEIEVIGPQRRFAAQNDGSVVLWLEAGGGTMLLGGDIEAIAQGELPPLRPDVLLVPHHGSKTTDLEWLADTVGDVAIISVGENSYGHPSPAVLETLAGRGVEVHLTRDEGDIGVPFR